MPRRAVATVAAVAAVDAVAAVAAVAALGHRVVQLGQVRFDGGAVGHGKRGALAARVPARHAAPLPGAGGRRRAAPAEVRSLLHGAAARGCSSAGVPQWLSASLKSVMSEWPWCDRVVSNKFSSGRSTAVSYYPLLIVLSTMAVRTCTISGINTRIYLRW
eukprot:SAG31_NODE_437_length_15714_cov_8.527344_6_plen_160_part_00